MSLQSAKHSLHILLKPHSLADGWKILENTQVRLGKGFTLDELKEAKISRKEALSIGIIRSAGLEKSDIVNAILQGRGGGQKELC